MEKNYYTYAYLREDGSPYYIGKGKNNRVYKKGKGEVNPPKDKSRIIFLKQNLTEEEAFKHEVYMIVVLGRKDLGTGILRNKTNGGDGTSGVVRSEGYRKKQSEAKKGEKHPNYGKPRSDETKIRMSESKKGKNHPYFGKSHSKIHKIKISKSVKKLKWWKDNCGNVKRSIECPGETWVPGRGKLKTNTFKDANLQKWQCLETGHISNPGGLSHYQKARGIDTTKRVRIS